jgi:phosphoadenosine phosphosulfate reductase
MPFPEEDAYLYRKNLHQGADCRKFTQYLTDSPKMENQIASLNKQFINSDYEEVLTWFSSEYKDKIAFSSSFSPEDQVIVRLISTLKLPVEIFTLDTGRLFQETYDLMEITRKKYDIGIKIYFPDPEKVEEMVNSMGINLFYESIERRRLCCHIRKREPLKRALEGKKVWITGMRREQSVTRSNSALVEWDQELEVIKLNPLIGWTEAMVWEDVRKNNIPVNELHSKGYPSIGCLPCTRPVGPGEDIRSGRWWWELPQNKECGLHSK